MSALNQVLLAEDVTYILGLPEVVAAKERIDVQTSGRVYFDIPLTETIKSAVLEKFGLDLSDQATIPMRWIKGDTLPHIDSARTKFTTTYLVYLNDSPGEFVVGDDAYPIIANSGFRFSEGVNHLTQGTGETARLLLGPMNEYADPVGFGVAYYPTENDALNFTNSYGGGSFTVGDGGPFGPGSGYTHWRLASNSGGTSSQAVVYNNGDVLISDGSYYLYPANPCFLEGTQILCSVDGVEKYMPIESLRKGTLVKTSRDGYKAVELIGKAILQNPGGDVRSESRLYKCSPTKYSELKEDLILTGCHSILTNTLTDIQREKTIKSLGRIFVTDKKYRLMACIDERAEPWGEKKGYPIWHFALENVNDGFNYGVYANGGLLVETCSIRFLKNKSNMTLV